jgi:class 3 adenylate cyclase
VSSTPYAARWISSGKWPSATPRSRQNGVLIFALVSIIIDDKDIYGDGVNIAARLEALAQPGGICVSRVVRDEVRDKLDFSFEDMSEQQVKNIARPVPAHRIRLDTQTDEAIAAVVTATRPLQI